MNQVEKMHYSHHINNLSGNTQSQWSIEKEEKRQVHVDGETQETHEKINSGQLRQGLTWPYAQYFPIVINDPFLTAYNAITSGMYSAFSSMIEYGPEADICKSKDHSHKSVKIEDKKPANEAEKIGEVKVSTEETKMKPEKEEKVEENMEAKNADIFDEVRLEAVKVNKNKEELEEKGNSVKNEKITGEMEKIDEVKASTEVTVIMPGEENKMNIGENMEPANAEIFDEVRLEAMKVNNKNNEKVNEDVEEEAEVREEVDMNKKNKEINFMQDESFRRKRDTTNIFMKVKNGGMIDINVQEPDIKR